MIVLPFAKIPLPSRRERPKLAPDEAADATLAVHPFLEPVGRHTVEFPEASGVGDEGPDRRGRLSEVRFPAEAVDGAIVCPHAAVRIEPCVGVGEPAPPA